MDSQMATLSDLQTARASAGAAYVSALAAFKAAWTTLAAYDAVLNNSGVRAPGDLPVATFRQRDRLALIGAHLNFAHNEFNPAAFEDDWEPAVQAELASLLASFSPG
jgi:hypothetical protein